MTPVAPPRRESRDARAAALRRGRDLLQPLQLRVAAARRALDLLERDLLPRSAGGDAYLVCGIVGPNNAGKSALFNALVGRDLSPSLPAGGATRRLVGAAAPALLARLRADPTLARFHLAPVASPVARLDAALQPAADPAELLLVADDQLPPTVMLIDTPDFDSIVHDNRIASESLLAVADLVIAVVTRHTYQNRAVVQFLRGWLDHGRPWMLLYNEAVNDDVAAAHAAKLITDVGHAPLAAFWAPHSFEVQDGRVPLIAQPLALDTGEESAGASLRAVLFADGCNGDIKARACAAALARLRDELAGVIAAVAADAAQARAVLTVADTQAMRLGRHVAATAMPAGPFVEAFRAVLDRRSNPLSRNWRAALRGVRLRLEDLAAALRGRQRSEPLTTERISLDAIERTALRNAWAGFWEELARDLGPEARHGARQRSSATVAAALDADLQEARRDTALAAAVATLGAPAVDLDAFRRACEELIEQAIDERGFDVDIQAAADLATLAPLALAAAVIVKTGGVGIDLALAGGGAVSSFLMEKYSHLLGSSILAETRRRWAEMRGAHVAAVCTDAVLARTAPELRHVAESEAVLCRELRRVQEIL